MKYDQERAFDTETRKESEVFLSAVDSGELTVKEESTVAEMERVGKKAVGLVHSQLLRIREEDSYLGEDVFCEVVIMKMTSSLVDKNRHRMLQFRHVAPSAMDAVAAALLPCSPLSGKSVKALHCAST